MSVQLGSDTGAGASNNGCMSVSGSNLTVA